ncbi:MAG: hypothetical protein QOG91_101 [Candidatus Parcubacteria bacterium]|jgi:hypothetical protein|nr:hypothetical protein [Candidatus Parcubacteria bacterium]
MPTRFGVNTADVAAKFAMFADLGVVTVPDDYEHGSRLGSFVRTNLWKFYHIDSNISDRHFPNPSRILKPGDKLLVQVFRQVLPGVATFKECMTFLGLKKAVYPGAQGASLVWEEKRNELPKDIWLGSYDDKSRLWKDADGFHWLPGVQVYGNGVCRFYLFRLDKDMPASRGFLCFSEIV